MRDRASVLLVVLDTARADAFEPYGATPGSSPAISQLAASGAAIRSAYASSSWTLPSHASMFAGLPARQLGLGQAPDGKPLSCRPVVARWADRWLPELARRNGYRTRGVSCNVWVSRASGFDLGFDSFTELTGRRRPFMTAPGWKARARWQWQAWRARVDAGASAALETVRGWLDEPGSQPLFGFVNLLECHSPYLPPRPWNDLSGLDRLRAGAEARRHLSLEMIWRASLTGTPVPGPALARMRHLYARAVRLMDDWVAALLELLERSGRREDTLVIVTSDHGENLGEERLMGHAFSIDERLVRVPLVTAGPGALGSQRLFSQQRLPGHLAEVMQLAAAPYEEIPRMQREIAVSVLEPMATPDHPAVEDVRERWGVGQDALRRLYTPAVSVTDGRWKLVRDADGERCYDLDVDPTGIRPQGVATLPGDLREHLMSAAGDALATPSDPPPQPSTFTPQDDVAELEDQLRLLGYL